jgi:CRP/FNR family transcriptional regulator, cyclic AMP receptor protein
MRSVERALLDADHWFGALPEDRRALLLGEGRVRAARPGERLYAIGDPPDGLWAVLSGQVRLLGYPAVGVEMLALILDPGAWFGELSTLDGGPRPHDAVAFTEARLLHLPMGAFERLAREHPALYRDVGLLCCAHQRATLAFLAQRMAQPAVVRLARVLAASARGSSDGQVRLRQSEIAAMMGVSRQTLNKALARLKEGGLVTVGYGRVTVVDAVALRSMGSAD